MVLDTLALYNVCYVVARRFNTNCFRIFSKQNHKHKSLNDLLVNMPKKAKHASKLRHVRYRERFEGRLPLPANIEVHVLGSGGRGTPRSVVISTDHSKYLFNCGEGTQRIASEHKMKIAKLENIFITHKSWDNIGGLLGMALTLEDTNVPVINIHGPPGVEKITKMVRAFADTTSVNIEKKELSEDHFEDFALKVDYVALERGLPNHPSNESRPSTAETEPAETEPAETEPAETESAETEPAETEPAETEPAETEPAETEPVTKKRRVSVEESDVVVAYICHTHPPFRKVNLQKCVELGITPGPIIGQITAGKSVTLDNGTVVTPEQVLSPLEEQRPFLVVECPEEDYLNALVSSAQLQELFTQKVALVVHMTPPEVMDTPEYTEWMNRFGTDTEHLVVNSRSSEVSQLGLYRIQAQLNLLHPGIFPLLPHFSLTQQHQQDMDQTPVVFASTNIKYQLRPKKGFIRDQCPQLDRDAFVNEVLVQKDLPQILEELKSKIQDKSSNSIDYPEIAFLGTGSSVPSKTRNASGIVLNLSADSTILLDCGEGTAGQLYRHYGDRTDDILCNIKAVFISHMHADHHLGLFNILNERAKAYKKKGLSCPQLLLLAPIQIARWLDFYTMQVEPVKEQLRLISHQSLLQHQEDRNKDVFDLVKSQLNLDDFLPVEVQHCRNAFGVAIVHKDGWKVVYSGDTMPCQRLVIAGQDCDLLIHEATMEDDLEEEAKFKTHSTTSQAIDVGVRMNAKFTLLTHFSQRYAKIPIFSDKFTDKVGIAFDNMRVRLSDLPLLPLFNSVLTSLFKEEYNDLHERRIKRTQRQFLKQKLEKSKVNSVKIDLDCERQDSEAVAQKRNCDEEQTNNKQPSSVVA